MRPLWWLATRGSFSITAIVRPGSLSRSEAAVARPTRPAPTNATSTRSAKAPDSRWLIGKTGARHPLGYHRLTRSLVASNRDALEPEPEPHHVQPVNFVDLKRQYASIKDEVDAAVLDAIASTQYILGEEVTRFESEWAEACGVDHCVGVSSGTAGLALAYEAVGTTPVTR